MRVLIACEFSGIVREIMAARQIAAMPAPSGETRGTPEKVCDWKAVGWTIDPKILGEIEDDPRVRAEGDPGLEMVEAILLAADWEPLAPEATTKDLNPPLPTDCSHERLDEDGVCRKCGGDQRGQAGQFVAPTKERRCPKCLTKYHRIYLEICPLCVPIPSTTAANPPGVNSRSDADRRPKQGTPAAPGEATTDEVQKSDETIFDSVKKWVAPGEAVGRETREQRFEKLSKQYGWERYERADISELLDFTESTLRRTS